MQTRSRWYSAAAICFLLFNLSPLIAAEFGHAKGIISLDGEPLAAGKITLHRDNGQFVGSKVKDGMFTIDHIPAGKFKVTIEGKGVAKKYETEENTVLTVTVAEGANVLDFALSK